MPQDQRRLNGPESVAYRFHSAINLKTYEEKLLEAYNAVTNLRSNGRKPGEARKLCKHNLLN